MLLYLERHVPQDNMHRFYRLDTGPDLFGIWCVSRGWGRVGTRGQSRLQSFATRTEAEQAHQRLSVAKGRRGYRDPVAG